MYTNRMEMTGNRFEGNWGGAAYGLLLKEISDGKLHGNVFYRNTTGLLADGANRLQADRNNFINNGWAVKLEASTQDGRFTRNNYIGNTFDVSSNSNEHTTTFAGNYWDSYEGYDLNHDGYGDVPFRPVRLWPRTRHPSSSCGACSSDCLIPRKGSYPCSRQWRLPTASQPWLACDSDNSPRDLETFRPVAGARRTLPRHLSDEDHGDRRAQRCRQDHVRQDYPRSDEMRHGLDRI